MKYIIKIVCIIIITITAIASCSLGDDAAINSRIDSFISGINNSDRTNVYLNFSTQVKNYNAIISAAFWDNNLTYLDAQYSLPVRSGVTDSGGGTRQVTATLHSKSYDDPVVFKLQQDSGVWLILEYDQLGTPVVKSLASGTAHQSIHIR